MTEDPSQNPEHWLADHGDYLYQYAYVRLRNRATAEDAVQETFLAGIQSLHRYHGSTPIRYWLRGILRYKVIDILRKQSREITVNDSDNAEILDSLKFKWFGIPNKNPSPWAFDPDKAYEQSEFWEIFYGCLSRLKRVAGIAFTLRELEGLSTEEICKELDMTPNNLWVVLHRARAQLKTCLESKWMQPETD